jgi:hypothetical protein
MTLLIIGIIWALIGLAILRFGYFIDKGTNFLVRDYTFLKWLFHHPDIQSYLNLPSIICLLIIGPIGWFLLIYWTIKLSLDK